MFCSDCDVAAEEAAVRPLQSRPLQPKNAQKGERILTMDIGSVFIHMSEIEHSKPAGLREGCAGPGRGGGDRAGGRPQRVSQVQRGGELCGGQRAGKRRVSLNL